MTALAQPQVSAQFGGLRVFTVSDDDGEPHEVVLTDPDPFTSLEVVLPRLEKIVQVDWLDQLLAGVLDGDKEADELVGDGLDQSLERAARGILTSGDLELINTLIGNSTRDEKKLTKERVRAVYKSNLGELRRTIAIALKAFYLDFFVSCVGPLRTQGAQLVKRLKERLAGGSDADWLKMAGSAFSGRFGQSPKAE